MSLLFPYKPNVQVNDFYETIQNIQDGFDTFDDFGKHVAPNLNIRNVKMSSQARSNFPMNVQGDGVRKSFSTSSFQENEQPNCYAKHAFDYRLEDHSTKGSFSSMTSIHSQSSALSISNQAIAGNATNGNNSSAKSKSKGSNRKKKNSVETDYRKKYKTEPCKYWTEKGFCEFGDQCAFAHGNNEIRQRSYVSSNYKTKKCNQFHETGYCPYGVRCQFIHSLRKDCQVNPVLYKASYVEEMENPDLWVTHDPDCICMQMKNRRRLPSFQQASNCESSKHEHDDDCKTCCSYVNSNKSYEDIILSSETSL